MVEIEQRVVSSLLCLPGNSISARAHLELTMYGAPDLGSAEAALEGGFGAATESTDGRSIGRGILCGWAAERIGLTCFRGRAP